MIKKITIASILLLTLILLPQSVHAAADCGWDCSGTTASCKSGGTDDWTGYCNDGSMGNCHEYCIGSINSTVNCGGVMQSISCDTATKAQDGCCRTSPPDNPPTATPTPTRTPTPTMTSTPTPSVTPLPSATPSPTTPANPAPVGVVESADCTSIKGYACDASNFQTGIRVHFFDGDFYAGGATVLGQAIADQARTDTAVLAACGNTGGHGFEFTTPASIKNNAAHMIYAYGIDIPAGNNNPALTGAPKTLTCAPVSPTPGAVCTQNASIVLPAAPAATNTPTPSPTSGPQMGLFKFKVKLQGVEWANIANETNKTQKVKVMFQIIKKTTDADGNTVYQTTLSKTFSDVTITAKPPVAGTISVWEGQFTPTGVSIGNNYVVFIKGFKHLQRKFCQNNPTERAEEGFPYRCLGEGQITLAAGENSFDFSNVLLQAGDLPVQDGVVNAYDVSVILNILKRGESRTAADLAAADIDLNGVVNAKDRSYLIETLEEKYGDEE